MLSIFHISSLCLTCLERVPYAERLQINIARGEQNESFSSRCSVVSTFSGHTIFSKQLFKLLDSHEKCHELAINGEVFWQQTQILIMARPSELTNRSARYNEEMRIFF